MLLMDESLHLRLNYQFLCTEIIGEFGCGFLLGLLNLIRWHRGLGIDTEITPVSHLHINEEFLHRIIRGEFPCCFSLQSYHTIGSTSES